MYYLYYLIYGAEVYYKEIIASLIVIASVLLVGCFVVVGFLKNPCKQRKK